MSKTELLLNCPLAKLTYYKNTWSGCFSQLMTSLLRADFRIPCCFVCVHTVNFLYVRNFWTSWQFITSVYSYVRSSQQESLRMCGERVCALRVRLPNNTSKKKTVRRSRHRLWTCNCAHLLRLHCSIGTATYGSFRCPIINL